MKTIIKKRQDILVFPISLTPCSQAVDDDDDI